MNVGFPVSHGISQSAAPILESIENRRREIKKKMDSLSLISHLGIAILTKLGVLFGVVAVGGFIATVGVLSIVSLKIMSISIVLSICCTALGVFINPCKSAESFIRGRWENLFQSLENGDGAMCIQYCQELASYKSNRKELFNQCLNNYDPMNVDLFFHKTLLIGYFILAVQKLNKGEEELSSVYAEKALSNFNLSGFPDGVKQCLKNLKDSPEKIRHYIELPYPGNKLYTLDLLSSANSSGSSGSIG